jgi:hypothetical protein
VNIEKAVARQVPGQCDGINSWRRNTCRSILKHRVMERRQSIELASVGIAKAGVIIITVLLGP